LPDPLISPGVPRHRSSTLGDLLTRPSSPIPHLFLFRTSALLTKTFRPALSDRLRTSEATRSFVSSLAGQEMPVFTLFPLPKALTALSGEKDPGRVLNPEVAGHLDSSSVFIALTAAFLGRPCPFTVTSIPFFPYVRSAPNPLRPGRSLFSPPPLQESNLTTPPPNGRSKFVPPRWSIIFLFGEFTGVPDLPLRSALLFFMTGKLRLFPAGRYRQPSPFVCYVSPPLAFAPPLYFAYL